MIGKVDLYVKSPIMCKKAAIFLQRKESLLKWIVMTFFYRTVNATSANFGDID